MEKTTIKVKGMVCTGCENRVKNALNEIKEKNKGFYVFCCKI